MATFQDNIETIRTAVYGKEMRPAISEALSQSWAKVESMMDAVDSLNLRADNLSGSGESGDDGSIIINSTVPPSTLIIYGEITPIGSVGTTTLLGD